MLKDLYESKNVTEVLNDTTIMSILMQISFYSEMGFLKYKDIVLILEEINSKSLNSAGNRERKIFFNKMYEQIDYLQEKLK